MRAISIFWRRSWRHRAPEPMQLARALRRALSLIGRLASARRRPRRGLDPLRHIYLGPF
jgi:hypothetical protein